MAWLPTCPLFGGWLRARVKEAGMKGGYESAAGMRPKKVGSAFCSHGWLLCPPVGRPLGIRCGGFGCAIHAWIDLLRFGRGVQVA